MSFVAHYLRPGDHFVDVGAGIGSYAVLAAGVGGAHVTAFEPSDAEAVALHRNVGLNALERSINCLTVGLGDVSGPGRIVVEPGLARRIVVDPCADLAFAVSVRRLDDQFSGNNRPRLIKIAASGDELCVLRGAHATLEHRGLEAVIVATEKLPRGASARWHCVCALLEKHEFVPAGYDPFQRRLLRGGASGRKGLFVRKPNVGAITRRLESAPHFWAGSALCL